MSYSKIKNPRKDEATVVFYCSDCKGITYFYGSAVPDLICSICKGKGIKNPIKIIRGTSKIKMIRNRFPKNKQTKQRKQK